MTLDPRVHAYLDGELEGDALREFEEWMGADAELARQVEALRSMDSWLVESRAQAPASIRSGVGARITEAVDPAVPSTAPTGGLGSWLGRFFPVRTPWIWAGATAAAVALLLWWTGAVDLRQPDGDSAAVPRGNGAPEVAASGAASSEVAPSEVAASEIGSPESASSDITSSEAGSPETRIRHEFLVEAEDARRVCLVGTFNRWTVCSTPLEEVREGLWRVALELPAGRHEYMFVVDDRWVTDPNSRVRADDGFGNENAVLLL